MSALWKTIRRNPISLLLLALPLAIIARYAGWSQVLIFTFSAIAVIPMADYIGEGTEVLAARTGPRIGGLLNATLGNAAELIITIFAIQEGLLELVKASITGSILGNLLFVMGFSMIIGGARHGVQRFHQRQATRNAILLILSVTALVIPSLLSHFIGPESSPRVEFLSLGVAVVMLVLYGLALLYGFKAEGEPLSPHVKRGSEVEDGMPVRSALALLAMATIGVVIASELLVGAVEPVVASLGVSEFFIGIILIPIIGNVAEHLVAVQVAANNQMDLSVEIAIASSLQIALFVAPVLVFLSLLLGNPLHLIFNTLELVALVAGVLITAIVSADGESNWLEGAQLLAVYFMLALAFFLLPA